MGKRSSFERRERDFYPTPPEAVEPLNERLGNDYTYSEPCSGDGALIRSLSGKCIYRSDISVGVDALTTNYFTGDYIITNPPWSRDILHPMIRHFSAMKPTWLLFDADWMHTRQAAEFLPWCAEIISVGRVKWIPDSPYTGKDNAAWYLFDRNAKETRFVGRAA